MSFQLFESRIVHRLRDSSLEICRSGFARQALRVGLLRDRCPGRILDAEPPHTPRGCIAQAWSVAELLRVMIGEL